MSGAALSHAVGFAQRPASAAISADERHGWAALVSVMAHLGLGLLVMLAMTQRGAQTPPAAAPATHAAMEVVFAAPDASEPASDAMPEAPDAPVPPPLLSLPAPPASPQLVAAIPPPPAVAAPPMPPTVVAAPPIPQLRPDIPPPPPQAALPANPNPIGAIPVERPATVSPPLPTQPAATPVAQRVAPRAATPRAAARPPARPGPAAAASNAPEPAPASPPNPAGHDLAAGPPLITAPRFRRAPQPPEYPARAVELDLTGTVIIRALLNAEGDPREIRVHRSSGQNLLDSAAAAAVRRWAFVPASRDGQRIEAWVEVPVQFRLN